MRRRGFTLVELMVVVCVISILATIAIPKGRDVRMRAEAVALQERIQSIRTAYIQADEPPISSLLHAAPGEVPASLRAHLPADAFRTEGGLLFDFGGAAANNPEILLLMRNAGSAPLSPTQRGMLEHLRANMQGQFFLLTPNGAVVLGNLSGVRAR